jgi:hypothetical protein
LPSIRSMLAPMPEKFNVPDTTRIYFAQLK